MGERLYWCSNCKENSVRRKVYVRKRDNTEKRVEYCINKGCKYKKEY